MNERKMLYRLGVLVVAVVLIMAIMVVVLGTPETFQKGYPVRVKFEDAGGVEVGTPVRNSGILIGRVSGVDLAEDGGAVVTLKIDEGRTLNANQNFRIAFTSVLGDVQLQVYRGNGPAKTIFVKTTDVPEGATVLEGESAINPMKEIDDLQAKLSEAVDVIAKTGKHLDEFITKSDSLIDGNENNINTIIKDLVNTVKEANATFQNINQIIGDEEAKENLRNAMNSMPDLVEKANNAIIRLDGTFESVERNLKSLEELTKPLGERGPAMVENVDGALENVKVLTARLATLADTLDSTEGTLGQLIHDDSLYRNLNQASKNIRDLSVKLKPIMNDVRVITDRMARHPGAIIRDAIRPGNGTKGMPGDFPPSFNTNSTSRSGPLLFNGLFRKDTSSTTQGYPYGYPCVGKRQTTTRQANLNYRQTTTGLR